MRHRRARRSLPPTRGSRRLDLARRPRRPPPPGDRTRRASGSDRGAPSRAARRLRRRPATSLPSAIARLMSSSITRPFAMSSGYTARHAPSASIDRVSATNASAIAARTGAVTRQRHRSAGPVIACSRSKTGSPIGRSGTARWNATPVGQPGSQTATASSSTRSSMTIFAPACSPLSVSTTLPSRRDSESLRSR